MCKIISDLVVTVIIFKSYSFILFLCLAGTGSDLGGDWIWPDVQ